MTAPILAPQPPRSSFLTDLIILSERIRRERITLAPIDYAEIPPAHVVAAMDRGWT